MTPAASPARRPAAAESRKRSTLVWIAAVLAPVAGALLIAAAFGVATVRNDSMSPTLHSGDTVVFDRWSTPVRGDVVLLVDREGWSGTADTLLVKRVVGVAGDVVACCEAGSGRLLVNGGPLDEPYATEERPGGDISFRVTVPEGAVWVMGDNRAESADSRLSVSGPGRGAVALEALRGTVRLWWGG
ncbi:signal peptidase I [Microbacterium trichothecenolyticum]|uniref:signal peptidase I n=1 Tax=Microbacterium trichothecenolyticum TaxID=69370 RepID=UPI001C6E7AAC|nr:signal peptidase I [Microbacterium trichothecenolyticum]MBW9121352.1 signal peptidase I [Microbacterium trichothecenolyticum]